MSSVNVLVIGAGPFGLSISAYLRILEVPHLLVGRPMNTWRKHMPDGLFLRSEPYGSHMASPRAGYTQRGYCEQHGFDYVHRHRPLSIERFLGYGDWYTRDLAPDAVDYTVTRVSAAPGGFQVDFAEASSVFARYVVVATGMLPYAYRPPELRGQDADLVSDTVDHHSFDAFAGRKVAVVGAGQSATQTAALLHEQGIDTVQIVRKPAINFLAPNPEHLSALGHVRWPTTHLCEGWHCAFWNSPTAYRRLPLRVKLDKTRTALGPAAAWWLKDRVDGVVEVLGGHRLTKAVPQGSGMRLYLDGPERDFVDVDHVMAGTGFRMDLARLSFLPDELRARIMQLNGFPWVDRLCESTVPGLYFVGVPASINLGPAARFISGTHHIAEKLARSLAKRTRHGDQLDLPEVTESASPRTVREPVH